MHNNIKTKQKHTNEIKITSTLPSKWTNEKYYILLLLLLIKRSKNTHYKEII